MLCPLRPAPTPGSIPAPGVGSEPPVPSPARGVRSRYGVCYDEIFTTVKPLAVTVIVTRYITVVSTGSPSPGDLAKWPLGAKNSPHRGAVSRVPMLCPLRPATPWWGVNGDHLIPPIRRYGTTTVALIRMRSQVRFLLAPRFTRCTDSTRPVKIHTTALPMFSHGMYHTQVWTKTT